MPLCIHQLKIVYMKKDWHSNSNDYTQLEKKILVREVVLKARKFMDEKLWQLLQWVLILRSCTKWQWYVADIWYNYLLPVPINLNENYVILNQKQTLDLLIYIWNVTFKIVAIMSLLGIATAWIAFIANAPQTIKKIIAEWE